MNRKATYFKSTEELVSMILGLLIVIFMGIMVINFFQKRNEGNVAVPGVSDEAVITEGDFQKGEKNVVTPETLYVVESGDSLWKIAEKKYESGYNWIDIAKANNLNNPGLLAVGQKLKLPAIEKKEATVKIVSGEYVVKEGDSLSKIALWSYGDKLAWVRIWEANKGKISDPDVIYKGTKLIIPKAVTEEKNTSDVGKG